MHQNVSQCTFLCHINALKQTNSGWAFFRSAGENSRKVPYSALDNFLEVWYIFFSNVKLRFEIKEKFLILDFSHFSWYIYDRKLIDQIWLTGHMVIKS